MIEWTEDNPRSDGGCPMARYTADEMREAANTFWVGGVICKIQNAEGRVVRHIMSNDIIAMLRQAAEMMESNKEVVKNY